MRLMRGAPVWQNYAIFHVIYSRVKRTSLHNSEFGAHNEIYCIIVSINLCISNIIEGKYMFACI